MQHGKIGFLDKYIFNKTALKVFFAVLFVAILVIVIALGRNERKYIGIAEGGITADATRGTEPAVTETGDTTAADTTVVTETEPPEPKVEIVLDGGHTFDVLMQYMRQTENIGLLKSAGTLLTLDEYLALCKEVEGVTVVTKIDLGGAVVDLAQGESDISGHTVEDKAKFDAMLAHAPGGIKLVMCDCGYTDDEMGALREKYPDIDFAWRIYMGQWSLRTDDEAFSVMIRDDSHVRLENEDIEVLRYCTNLYALDLGHQALTDLTVVGELTDLRVLILADNLFSDITPLSNLKNLQYLELFVSKVEDLTPIAACTELVDLNFGWTRVSDLTPIYSLEKLERLWLPHTRVPYAVRGEIEEKFPEATIIFEDKDSVSSGWRTHERYFTMRGMFNNNKYNPDFVK